MIPNWSVVQQQFLVNAVFASYAIPVEVEPLPVADVPGLAWDVRVFGGTLQAAVERIHEKQDRIIARIRKYGMSGVTRSDALFMYASGWLECTFLDSGNGEELQEALEMMEGWAILFVTRAQSVPN